MMSPRQIIFGKKFKTPLYKIGELVLAYDVLSSNKTSTPRVFYALYIESNDGGTGHSIFKLSTKKLSIPPRCKPIHMCDNVMEVVNQMREDDRIMDRRAFCDILKESTIDDMRLNNQKPAAGALQTIFVQRVSSGRLLILK